jgi:hypothetical protein
LRKAIGCAVSRHTHITIRMRERNAEVADVRRPFT